MSVEQRIRHRSASLDGIRKSQPPLVRHQKGRTIPNKENHATELWDIKLCISLLAMVLLQTVRPSPLMGYFRYVPDLLALKIQIHHPLNSAEAHVSRDKLTPAWII